MDCCLKLECLISRVERLTFELIREKVEGEIDEEWFDDKKDRQIGIAIYYVINDITEDLYEEFIYHYGIQQALTEYLIRNNRNEIKLVDIINVNFYKKLIYCIVENRVNPTFSQYREFDFEALYECEFN
jgi:hypothetical protein